MKIYLMDVFREVIAVVILSSMTLFHTTLFANDSSLVTMPKDNNGTPDKIEWDAGGLFEGSFEDGTIFQMNMPYPATPKLDDRNLSQGKYWYPKKYSANTMIIQVKQLDKNNKFKISVIESNIDNPVEIEEFSGTFSSGRKSASGVWKNHKRGKIMKFEMIQLMEYKAVAIQNKNFEFDVKYPVSKYPAIDKYIMEHVSQCDHDRECSNIVDVDWYSKDMIVLTASEWGYSEGMSHGNGSSRTKHFLIADDVVTELGLDHFIKVSPVCLKNISNRIIAKLKKSEASNAEGGALLFEKPRALKALKKPAKNLNNDYMPGRYWKNADFTATPSGIRFNFNSYEVATYAEGMFEAFITRDQLGDCLNFLPTFKATIPTTQRLSPVKLLEKE